MLTRTHLVGITVPKLLPVTGTFAPGQTPFFPQPSRCPLLTIVPAFAAYFVLLNLRISVVRQSTKTFIGGDSKETSKPATGLLVASRSQANFVENVPLALLVASFAEINGGDRRVLTASLAALLFFRIVHVEFGLKAKDSLGWGRPVGYLGTQGLIVGLSAYAAWLVKSYWGF